MNIGDIKIGKNVIGVNKAPLFLPDIGTFFNQDMACAKQLVKDLHKAGLSVIKGEILHNADICLNDDTVEKYYGYKSNEMHVENYRSLIERKIVSLDSYQDLFRYCQSLGMEVVLSVYDFEGVSFAKELGAVALKVATSNITHQPLIEKIARTGLPVIMDTGHSSMEEIARAVNWLTDVNKEAALIIEHSPLPPPNPVSTQNLNFMKSLGSAFNCLYGLSDHHGGDEILYAAAALGAGVIEVGVMPEHFGNDQDGGHALLVNEVATVFKKINNIYLALGTGQRVLERSREKYKSRMGLVAKSNLKSGDSISLESTSFAFPAKGIPVEYWAQVLGATLNKSVCKGKVITWEDLNFVAS